jgi:glycosyltransferase involved in cell wall biosynthesis
MPGHPRRILLLVDCYLPSPKSSAKLMHDLACELHRQGCAVTLIAPDDTLEASRQITVESGFTVVRIRTGQIKGAGKIKRAWNETRLSSRIWGHAGDYLRDHPADLVVFYSPSIFFGPLVARLKKLWNCPSYLILRDIFPKWAVDAGVLRRGPAFWFFRWVERRQYLAADVIGVQSPANLDYFQAEGLSDKLQLDVLYNWTTLNEPDVPRTNFRKQWGLEDKVVFFYGGNIGVAQDMPNLVRLAAAIRNLDHVRLAIVGEGSEVDRLKAMIRESRLENIAIYPAVNQTEYLGMLAEFDVGLISLDRKLNTQNFPGKMLGYMYHAMPMLASVNPGNDLKELLQTYQAGFASENGQDAALLEQATRLANDAVLRARMGQNGRRLLEEKFAVARCATQILSHFAVRTAEIKPELPVRAAA